MADITICVNKECPVKDKCYRSIAPWTPLWQAVAKYEYDTEKGCEAFWEVKSKSQVKRLDIQTRKE